MLKSGLSCLGFALLGTAALALSPTAAAGGLAANIAGNFGTDFVRRTAERYFARRGAIGENDVVVRELRRAQLNALRTVLQRFDRARASDPEPDRRAQAEIFSDLLKKFLDQETRNINTLTWEGLEGTADQENVLRRQVLESLPESFDEGLAARHLRQVSSGPGQAGAGLKGAAETVVLEELTRRLVLEEIPSLFRSAFQGGPSGSDGWFDLFIRDAAGSLKAGGEFERIWNAEQIV